VASPFF
jgi:hypothetical protein